MTAMHHFHLLTNTISADDRFGVIIMTVLLASLAAVATIQWRDARRWERIKRDRRNHWGV